MCASVWFFSSSSFDITRKNGKYRRKRIRKRIEKIRENCKRTYCTYSDTTLSFCRAKAVRVTPAPFSDSAHALVRHSLDSTRMCTERNKWYIRDSITKLPPVYFVVRCPIIQLVVGTTTTKNFQSFFPCPITDYHLRVKRAELLGIYL